MISYKRHHQKALTSLMTHYTGMNSWFQITVDTVHQKEAVGKVVPEEHHLVAEWVVAPWA